MIKNISNKILKFTSINSSQFSSSSSEGSSFLKMVESYFDKAGIHTHIRADKLNFYKKADNVVKCNISIVKGNPFI